MPTAATASRRPPSQPLPRILQGSKSFAEQDDANQRHRFRTLRRILPGGASSRRTSSHTAVETTASQRTRPTPVVEAAEPSSKPAPESTQPVLQTTNYRTRPIPSTQRSRVFDPNPALAGSRREEASRRKLPSTFESTAPAAQTSDVRPNRPMLLRSAGTMKPRSFIDSTAPQPARSKRLDDAASRSKAFDTKTRSKKTPVATVPKIRSRVDSRPTGSSVTHHRSTRFETSSFTQRASPLRQRRIVAGADQQPILCPWRAKQTDSSSACTSPQTIIQMPPTFEWAGPQPSELLARVKSPTTARGRPPRFHVSPREVRECGAWRGRGLVREAEPSSVSPASDRSDDGSIVGSSDSPALLPAFKRSSPIPERPQIMRSSQRPSFPETPPIETPAGPPPDASQLIRHQSLSLSPDSSISKVPQAPRRKPSGRGALMLGILSDNPGLINLACDGLDDDATAAVTVPPPFVLAFPRVRGEECFLPLAPIQRPAIALAVKCSSVAVFRQLILLGANPKQRDAEGRTLLHLLFLPLPEAVTLSALEEDISQQHLVPIHLSISATQSPAQSPAPMITTGRTSLVTPRIAEGRALQRVDPSLQHKSGKCSVLLPRSRGDTLSQILELIWREGVEVGAKDDAGYTAAEYAKLWLQQAANEINDLDLSFQSRLAAACVHAAALTILTLEDHVKLSLIVPHITSYPVRSLVKPQHCSDGSLSDVKWRRSPCRWGKSKSRSSIISGGNHQSPLKHLLKTVGSEKKSHAAFLPIFEFLGASFS